MKLIVGLGNPGRDYIATRHNIGFDTITRLCDQYQTTLDFRKHKALCGKCHIAGEKVLLAQPQTYMNLSGESVREMLDYYKLSPEDLIIIYDDTSLDTGQLRVRPKGSAGGHNGIKSIIAHLGMDEFPRIRIGIGEKPRTWDLADYVLSRFKEEEQPSVREAIARAAEASEYMISNGIEAAMNEYNRKKEKER